MTTAIEVCNRFFSNIQTLIIGYLSKVTKDIRCNKITTDKRHKTPQCCITCARLLASGSFSPKKATLDFHARRQVAYTDSV